MDLHLNDSELASCVGCGLCLAHCPTYRVTSEEGLSPRGRIAAMRRVQWEGAEVDATFVEFMETCVQCRGCEPACPSGVPYGHLIEATRTALTEHHRSVPRWQRVALSLLGNHRLVLVGSSLLAVAQRIKLIPRRLGLPPLPLRRGPRLQATGSAAWLFTGCVMDAWQRGTHRATQRVLAASGVECSLAAAGGDCCGALHSHAGLHDQARRRARRTIASMPGEAAVVVNSAGCGAAMKEYGHLLDTDQARVFSARVVDVHEFLARRLDALPAPLTGYLPPTVIVQEPCHLRHVQRTQDAVRTVLAPYATLIPLDDDGLCCGAGGAYSALQPELADQIRARKFASIERAQTAGPVGATATILASANPGCAMHLAEGAEQRGLRVVHPMEIIDQAIGAR